MVLVAMYSFEYLYFIPSTISITTRVLAMGFACKPTRILLTNTPPALIVLILFGSYPVSTKSKTTRGLSPPSSNTLGTTLPLSRIWTTSRPLIFWKKIDLMSRVPFFSVADNDNGAIITNTVIMIGNINFIPGCLPFLYLWGTLHERYVRQLFE